MKSSGSKNIDWVLVGAVFIPCYFLFQLFLWPGFILPRWAASASTPFADALISFAAAFSSITFLPATYALFEIILALRVRRGEYYLRLGKMALTRGDKVTAKRFLSKSRRWGTNWNTRWKHYEAVIELAKEQLRSGMIDDVVETIRNNECAPYWLKQFSLQMLHADRFDEALTIANGITNDASFHAEIVTRIAIRMARQGKTQEARRIFFDLIRQASVSHKTTRDPYSYQSPQFPRIIQGMILAGFLDDAEFAVREFREDADVPNGAVAVALAKEGQEERAVELEGRIANVTIRANTAKRMGVGQAQHGFLDAADRSFQRGVHWTELIDDPYERVKSCKALAYACNKYLSDGVKPVEKLIQRMGDDIEQIENQEQRRIAVKMLEKLKRNL